GVSDHVLLKAIAASLRGRGSRCTFQEAGSQHAMSMDNAAEIAALGMENDEQAILRTDIPAAYELKGAKLRTGTQRSFYKTMIVQRPRPERIKTTIMLDMTRHAAHELSGRTPTDDQIWLALRHRDITRTTRDFMWRCMHQAYKIGDYWRSIPTYENRAICQVCNVDETMEHILLERSAPGQESLWKLAQELWELKGHPWPDMSIGKVLACGMADFKSARGKSDAGANRLFRILISETMHQIWKERCLRVIERGNDPEKATSEAELLELHNKWLHCINARLKSDALLTDTKKYGSRALKLKTVLRTW
ncbi:hypothetical protein B0H15DRAFT_760568, partial [Mycena belliarum]